MNNPNIETFATLFKALGDPTRLRIFEFLRGQCCPIALEEDGSVHPVRGKSVGEVCCHILGEEKITSTFSHHLKELRIAGLVETEREGKHILCRLNPETLQAVEGYWGRTSVTLPPSPCCGENVEAVACCEEGCTSETCC